MVGNRRLIVRGERENQRAFASQLDVDAGRALKLRGEGWPARLALAAERDQRLFARLRLAAGGQHSGGGVARAGTRLAALENGDRGAAGEPPGDAEPDDARADDDDARASDRCDGIIVPVNAAPFAGMTQTGSMGVISADPSLTPHAAAKRRRRHPWPMPQ